ncbi:MAG: beta-lactamase family protein [Planctomycetes bacterium]|nr:beta-lactamase family protein [Planctomycetota bacterium]
MPTFSRQHAVGVVWVVLASVLVGARAEATETLEEIVDSIAGEVVESGSTPGLSVGIARGDEVLLAKGYGLADVELSASASEKTVYRIGSITKQFTAAAILLLAEDGDLALDDPIARFLPNYPTQGKTITVRHLLSHTSGIKSFTNMPSYRREMRNDVSHEEIIDRFKDAPPNFAPGEKFRYCNSGYYLLGVILEKASGQSYADFLGERLFRPLALENTCYDRHARIIANRASGYSRSREGFRNAPYVSMTQPFSAGALVSTVEDLIAWQRALIGGKLLSADSYQSMTSPATLNDGRHAPYGLGVFTGEFDGHTVVRHGGGIKGFRSELAYLPEIDHTIVVLANGESAQPEKLSRRIAKHLFGEEQEKGESTKTETPK